MEGFSAIITFEESEKYLKIGKFTIFRYMQKSLWNKSSKTIEIYTHACFCCECSIHGSKISLAKIALPFDRLIKEVGI